MKKILLFSLLLVPLPLCAETYQWTDSKGTVNFTEDLGKVPKKYRKKVRIIGGDDTPAPQVTEVTETKQASKAADRQGEKKALYGGKDEKGWRTEFAQVKGELKLAEQDLADFRNRLKDPSRMSRTEYLSIQNSIKQEEFRVQSIRKRLDSLTATADQAGVPADFRQ